MNAVSIFDWATIWRHLAGLTFKIFKFSKFSKNFLRISCPEFFVRISKNFWLQNFFLTNFLLQNWTSKGSSHRLLQLTSDLNTTSLYTYDELTQLYGDCYGDTSVDHCSTGIPCATMATIFIPIGWKFFYLSEMGFGVDLIYEKSRMIFEKLSHTQKKKLCLGNIINTQHVSGSISKSPPFMTSHD